MSHASQHSPRNAACRGGVFATRRFPRPPPHSVPHRDSKEVNCPRDGGELHAWPTGAIRATKVTPSPYHRRTIVSASSDFALRRNPNMKRRRCYVGTAMVRRRYGGNRGDLQWASRGCPLVARGGDLSSDVACLVAFLNVPHRVFGRGVRCGLSSDAACRVVIPPFAVPIDSRINLQDARIGCRYASNGVNVGRSHYAATTSPQCRL